MQGNRDSESRAIFASGIRNPGLWKLEFSLSTPDSRQRIPDSTLQDCLTYSDTFCKKEIVIRFWETAHLPLP